MTRRLRGLYRRLFAFFGPQHWWPGDTRFEIIVGAILTQNTNWGNVERAIANLRRARVLRPAAMRALPPGRLAELIQPSGYFNVKARRLNSFLDYLFKEHAGSLRKLAAVPLPRLRGELLAVNGIGPETADSILLYAFGKPVFVIDAYTKRVLYRHGIIGGEREGGAVSAGLAHDYHAVQRLFHEALPANDAALFNEYHALIVRLGKEFCKPTPRCEACPLRDFHYDLSGRCSRCFRSGGGRDGGCPQCRPAAPPSAR